MQNHKDLLDLSSIQIYGSHTIAKKGGEQVGYQGRKKNKTSNMIFLSDNTGNILTFSDVYAGNYNALYNISGSFDKMLSTKKNQVLEQMVLFCNADAGFDSKELKKISFIRDSNLNVDKNKRNGKDDDNQEVYHIFDKELYKNRFVIERANAWIDSFKTLLVRFTIKAENWLALYYIALTVRLLKKKV